MNYIDIILFIVLTVAFVLGFKDGFVRKLIGTVGFFLALFLSISFSTWLGKIIFSVTGIEQYLSEILAGFTIFITILVLAAFLKRVIHPFDKVNNLINRIVGGLTGTIQMLIFLSAALYLLNIFDFPDEKVKEDSFLYSPVYKILPFAINSLQAITPDAKESIKEYIIEKDSI
ncbi:MAG TPA: CvpA family protein [Ignavibacteriaceae bacterium]|nr:CvpA family protein [Ignavibacteriaceae bacterium]